jgi:transposase
MEYNDVLSVIDGKDSGILGKFSIEFMRYCGNPYQITDFAIDMSPAFINGINNNFPNASITFDKFHVIMLYNEMIDEVRRAEVKENPELVGTSYIWLHNVENLTKKTT